MARIPFKLPDVGLKKIMGLVFVDNHLLVLRIESSLLGLINVGENEVKIEPGELEELRIKRGLFKDRLVITPLSADILDKVPGRHLSSIELRISRKYRKDLKTLVGDVEGTVW